MGHRLSKITTRTGDAGETGLGDGSRVPKDSPRVRALGDIDELNSAIGVLLAEELPPELRDALGEIQHDLFDLGGELSIPGHALLGDAQVARLEERLEAWNAGLPPLKEFILPGGTRSEEHTSELQSPCNLVCRLLLEKKKTIQTPLCSWFRTRAAKPSSSMRYDQRRTP